MPATVAESYQYCRRIARQRAKNFYYSFLLLDKHQHDAMCAIYTFMRICDDLSDDPAQTDPHKIRRSIAEWRLDTNHALRGEFNDQPLWPAFFDAIKRYKIPHRYFHEMIDGITSDLDPRAVQNFDELYRYCYQVASVVGLTIIHIFGFESVAALILAEKCGIAFQLTNILRDVREDATLGRVYLPLDELARFGITKEQLEHGAEDDRFRMFMKFQAERVRRYYEESAPLAALVHQRSRPSLWALRAIYQRLLDRIENSNYAVLSHRINVPTHTKMALLLRAFIFRPA